MNFVFSNVSATEFSEATFGKKPLQRIEKIAKIAAKNEGLVCEDCCASLGMKSGQALRAVLTKAMRDRDNAIEKLEKRIAMWEQFAQSDRQELANLREHIQREIKAMTDCLFLLEAFVVPDIPKDHSGGKRGRKTSKAKAALDCLFAEDEGSYFADDTLADNEAESFTSKMEELREKHLGE